MVKYHLTAENLALTSEQLITYLEKLVDAYPIITIEDGLAENDWNGWELLTKQLGKRIQIVGDDILSPIPNYYKKESTGR